MMKLIKMASMFIILSISLQPIQIFAHGTEDEHKKEILLSTYFLGGFFILLILFFVLFMVTRNRARQLQNVKKQEDREKRLQLTKTANLLKWIWIAALLGTVVSGGIFLSNSEKADGTNNNSDNVENIILPDVHGVGYSPNGESVIIPAHDGLKLYSDGVWSNGQGEQHDYMGFTAVNDGFYSSGHPARGSSKKNPFGIVKSTDGGRTFKTLTLYGEVDFHLMSSSYNTHTIYVVNPRSNSQMKDLGLYYSKDEAKTWVKSQMSGFNDRSNALAVHPDNDAIVALSSQEGLYLSRDYGDHFEKLSDVQITSLSFSPSGKLLAGGFDQRAVMLKIDIESGEQTFIEIPTLMEDVVKYIAQNPKNKQELVFTTNYKDVYLTENQGTSWTKIADKGIGINQ